MSVFRLPVSPVNLRFSDSVAGLWAAWAVITDPVCAVKAKKARIPTSLATLSPSLKYRISCALLDFTRQVKTASRCVRVLSYVFFMLLLSVPSLSGIVRSIIFLGGGRGRLCVGGDIYVLTFVPEQKRKLRI